MDYVTRQRKQRVQNTCCRLVFGLKKNRLNLKVSKILQWLPMSQIWETHMVTFVHRVYLKEILAIGALVSAGDLHYIMQVLRRDTNLL